MADQEDYGQYEQFEGGETIGTNENYENYQTNEEQTLEQILGPPQIVVENGPTQNPAGNQNPVPQQQDQYVERLNHLLQQFHLCNIVDVGNIHGNAVSFLLIKRRKQQNCIQFVKVLFNALKIFSIRDLNQIPTRKKLRLHNKHDSQDRQKQSWHNQNYYHYYPPSYNEYFEI